MHVYVDVLFASYYGGEASGKRTQELLYISQGHEAGKWQKMVKDL